MANKVVICGIDTSKLPRISSKEMVELMKKVKANDNQARHDFVIYNMRLVLSIIQRFCIKQEIVDDVFQVGVIGLLKSIDNFDMSLNVKFSTYAVPMIIGEIRKFIRDGNSVKVTRNLRDIAYKALQARDKLGKDNEPSIEDIAREIDVSPREICDALDAISEPISIFESVLNDGSEGLLVVDQLQDTTMNEEKWIEKTSLQDAILNLEQRERNILFLRYFEGQTQMEVSEKIGISQAQVSRLEKNALSNIKESL